jgi:hypothetical protein
MLLAKKYVQVNYGFEGHAMWFLLDTHFWEA